jgi:serine/threonine protein kinase
MLKLKEKSAEPSDGTASPRPRSPSSIAGNILRSRSDFRGEAPEDADERKATEEFAHEAHQLSRVPQYASIVSFFGESQDPSGNRYLLSEFIDGGSLEDLLWDRRRELGDRDFANIATVR